ncbi:hypothetical protein OJ997_03700 [Solirubrobacter phytolaccae]|uniref:Uncharacterized protein n=1 Tax=Solirubrobacter phytolaccae TaxID=1404360 RepID=A0A9X3S5X3_9ACTN|nr:hypothetical protein [Solirubrobacter phytolaccae]MDA0179389.1 hypothetical protein [Solirubrobacter phytolaccae]
MRWLIFAFTLTVTFTTFALVSFVDLPEPEDEQVQQFPNHEPESDEEKAAAGAALAFVHALNRERPADACRVVAEPLTTAMRCTKRPRIPRDLQVSAIDRVRVFNIRLQGATGEAWVSGTSPGPALSISVRRVDDAWRVVANNGGFGLA